MEALSEEQQPFSGLSEDVTVQIIDHDSNRLMREKEKEAILKEKESCYISDKPEDTKEAIEKYFQIMQYCIKKAHTNEEMEHVKDCLETCANKLVALKFKSFPPGDENFPPNKNIRSQRQHQEESRPFKKQKHAHAKTHHEK
ncbi:hypothetical protein NPIL_132391 [Nephila pilipes]|uniref:Uncharacterized protein n=1 Tax=Nephila pilipes TaxID=299642 RepID=A0A8X6PBL3_NEPPI|nr:hypothetical protein NPIL_132391 [Nephila pilipes]